MRIKTSLLRALVIVLLLIAAAVFGFSRYRQHRQQSELLRNIGRVAFILHMDKVPASLIVESSYVDSWTEYHLVIACRDRSGSLDYLLTGREWKLSDASPPWVYRSDNNKDLDFTIVREAKWHEGDKVFASVLFDRDGERFVVEYHSL